MLSAFVYPLILTIFWIVKKDASIRKVVVFIWKANVAQKLNTQMIEETDIVVYAPNLIGTLTTLLIDRFDIMQTSKEVMLGFLIGHFCLIALTAIGKAFLKMANTKAVVILMGEILIEWALVGGSLLFIFQIFAFRGIVGDVLSGLLIFVMMFFLFSYGAFRMIKSAQIYAEGALRPPSKPSPPTEEKFLVKIAGNFQEAEKLAKEGYEKFDELDGKHIYRKQKETN